VTILLVIEEFLDIRWWAGNLPGTLVDSLSYWLLKKTHEFPGG
jgi:hypothetical protein